jgi:hypothetical protein
MTVLLSCLVSSDDWETPEVSGYAGMMNGSVSTGCLQWCLVTVVKYLLSSWNLRDHCNSSEVSSYTRMTECLECDWLD